jgi:TatD DNase family protein
MRLYDAHNHLQDERLAAHLDGIAPTLSQAGVHCMVVNGSCEEDWQSVLELARRFPFVVPSFGYHPWYVGERTEDWQAGLVRMLDATPSAVGEIGLDRWILEPGRAAALNLKSVASLPEQEEVFVWQLRLSAERNLPVSIHCLQAWGALLEILQREPLPRCGFLLHSYGGPREMVASFARLGAYFSLPGYFAHERKQRQREAFLAVPPDRLLLETDAPDQLLPDARNRHPLTDAATGKPLNHPANLAGVYEFAAGLFGEPAATLAARVEANFTRLFGGLRR